MLAGQAKLDHFVTARGKQDNAMETHDDKDTLNQLSFCLLIVIKE